MICRTCGYDQQPCPRSARPGHGRECYLCCPCLLEDTPARREEPETPVYRKPGSEEDEDALPVELEETPEDEGEESDT